MEAKYKIGETILKQATYNTLREVEIIGVNMVRIDNTINTNYIVAYYNGGSMFEQNDVREDELFCSVEQFRQEKIRALKEQIEEREVGKINVIRLK